MCLALEHRDSAYPGAPSDVNYSENVRSSDLPRGWRDQLGLRALPPIVNVVKRGEGRVIAAQESRMIGDQGEEFIVHGAVDLAALVAGRRHQLCRDRRFHRVVIAHALEAAAGSQPASRANGGVHPASVAHSRGVDTRGALRAWW